MQKECMKLLEDHPSPRAVWIMEPFIIVPAVRELSNKVVEYVRNGGIAILGGLFASCIDPSSFNDWIRDVWNLPWRWKEPRLSLTRLLIPGCLSERLGISVHP
ncbi:hypothetical protein F5Y05DRAFT_378904 [Hypoxylon sp. FL0543]|nr:hypothetical protein F5Y05DRAFT_378904 [Hypoxylon sp. FL0543]